MPTRPLGRVSARHLIALVPRTAAIELAVLVPVVTGMNSIRIHRIAVFVRRVAADAVIVQSFSDALSEGHGFGGIGIGVQCVKYSSLASLSSRNGQSSQLGEPT